MMRSCRICGEICFVDGPCPSCEKKHEKQGNVMPVYAAGCKRAPSLTLDMQEGNDEEYFGGLDFADMRTWWGK
jgi:hypothetical protein